MRKALEKSIHCGTAYSPSQTVSCNCFERVYVPSFPFKLEPRANAVAMLTEPDGECWETERKEDCEGWESSRANMPL